MKRIVLKTYGKFIAALLAFVSFMTGCDVITGGGVAEYGVPSADFIVRGKVTDKESEKPINNIAIIRKTPTSPYGNDTVKTNANGEFKLNFTDYPKSDHWIYAEDLDGDANGGLYTPDSIKITSSTMKQTKKGSGIWNQGTFEKTDANFQLKHQSMAMYGTPSAEYKKKEEKK